MSFLTRHATSLAAFRRAETINRSWEDRSACYNRPEAWWDGDDPQLTEKARRTCLGCPVFARCLDKTMGVEDSRIWARAVVRAGMTGTQRVQLFVDAREFGPYDGEEARLLALEVAATGRRVSDVVEEPVTESTLRLAQRLADEPVSELDRPSVVELRGGTARERAFKQADTILRLHLEDGLSRADVAKQLRIHRNFVAQVLDTLGVPATGKGGRVA